MNPSTITALTLASSAASAIALLLSGCAGYGPGRLQTGQSESEVRRQLGVPTERVALPDGGARLDYARGPMGKHTWRVEIGADGRVANVSQLLTEANFESMPTDLTAAQVRERLGPPSETHVGWQGKGEVWFYRYDTPPPYCRGFLVWLVDGRVREASYAPDPVCDDRRRDPD